MNKRIHVLHLEDEPDFAALVREMFAQDGLDADVLLAGSRGDFEKALAKGHFNVVISDYHLPSFTGLQALELVKKTCRTRAVYPGVREDWRDGGGGMPARGSDRLSAQTAAGTPAGRRPPRRQEAAERARLREAELELVRREKYFRALTENSQDVLCIISPEGRLLYASPSIQHVLGYQPEELRGENVLARVHVEDLPHTREKLQFSLEHPEQRGHRPVSLPESGRRMAADGTRRQEPAGRTGNRRHRRQLPAT